MPEKILTPVETPFTDIAAESQRGNKSSIEISNFWNQPFPNYLKTISSATANFKKSLKKTHTSLYRRRCALKLEITLSNGTTQLVDIGTYLLSKIQIVNDEVTLSLDDLSKPLTEKSAQYVRNGFNWYQNVSIKFLVEELIKELYFDERNGEVPRDFIINDMNVEEGDLNPFPVISAIGKPPLQGRLTPSTTESLAHSIVNTKFDGTTEELYIGVGPQLLRFDSARNYTFEACVLPTSAHGQTFNIMKMWYVAAKNKIYGVAWPTEELVNTEIATDPNNPPDYPFQTSCPVAVDFILFTYSPTTNLEILYNSTTDSAENTKKLITGQYHIVPPHFQGGPIIHEDDVNYVDFNVVTHGPQFLEAKDLLRYISGFENPVYGYGKGILQSLGNFNSDGFPSGICYKVFNGSTHHNPLYLKRTENITIPFAQTLGLSINKITGRTNSHYNTVLNNSLTSVSASWYAGWTDTDTPIAFYIFPRKGKSSADYIPGKLKALGLNPTINFILTSNLESQRILHPRCNKSFNGLIPGFSYNFKGDDGFNRFTCLPYFDSNLLASTIGVQFDPGYYAYFYDNLYFMNYRLSSLGTFQGDSSTPWSRGIAWPWFKFTSAQTGSICLLIDNLETTHPIFMLPIFSRNPEYQHFSNNNPEHFSRKCITPFDLKKTSESDLSAVITPLKFDYDIYCFFTNNLTWDKKVGFNPYSGDGQRDLVFKDGNSGTIKKPYQLTASDVCGINSRIALAGFGFRNETDVTASYLESRNSHQCCLKEYRYVSNGESSLYETLIGFHPLTNSTICPTYANDAVITDCKYMEDRTTGDIKLVIAGYHRNLMFEAEPESGYRPTLSESFHFLTVFDPEGIDPYQEIAHSKYQFQNLKVSEDLHDLYFTQSENRNENSGGFRLKKFTLESTAGVFSTTITELADATFVMGGDSNVLSNIELLNLHDMETVFGVSAGYYPHPINKLVTKNYLWKYDKTQSGMIELADFSGMKIWDALSKLAQASNFLMGFDNDTFFFVPKTVSSTPDIILDLDIDKVIKAEKSMDYNVKNIIKATPYKTSLKNAEWTITTIAYDANDLADPDIMTRRNPIKAQMIVQSYDTIPKTILLKTETSGTITDFLQTTSPLRFSFLVYHSTIESRLLKNYLSGDTIMYLSSLYGSSIEDEIHPGDVISIVGTDTSGESVTYNRLITATNSDNQSITLESSIAEDFEAFTVLTIIRGTLLPDNTLIRNQAWSDLGVAYSVRSSVWRPTTTLAIAEVSSISNLSKNTIIRFANVPGDYRITATALKYAGLTDKPTITFEKATTAQSDLNTVFGADGATINMTNKVISAYWMPPNYNSHELNEIGGTGVKAGFADGSVGVFWINSKGADTIEIKCPGLVLEQDSNATLIQVDKDSIELYGNQEESLESNPFIQIPNIKLVTKAILDWKSKPGIQMQIQNVVQAMDNGGNSYQLPVFKILNTSEKKLYRVRLISQKLFPMFEGYALDCYIAGHSLNVKDFTHDLNLVSVDSY